jgi:hypothetical protein
VAVAEEGRKREVAEMMEEGGSLQNLSKTCPGDN